MNNMTNKNKIFARINENGDYNILHTETREIITTIDINEYPIDSTKSCRYEHPNGIVFSLEQCQNYNIDIE